MKLIINLKLINWKNNYKKQIYIKYNMQNYKINII